MTLVKYKLVIPTIVYRDIANIQNYIALDKPSVAKQVARKIFQAIENLTDGINLGQNLKNKFDIDSDLRFRLVSPYIILFMVEENVITLYRVLDARSDYLVRIGLKQSDKD